jgi:hypothetical protein
MAKVEATGEEHVGMIKRGERRLGHRLAGLFAACP